MDRMVKFQTISYKPGAIVFDMKPIPYIRITNKSLEDFGFKCGDKIVVIYEIGKLTILTPEYCKKLTNSKKS
jgi:hypothetical protein